MGGSCCHPHSKPKRDFGCAVGTTLGIPVLPYPGPDAWVRLPRARCGGDRTLQHKEATHPPKRSKHSLPRAPSSEPGGYRMPFSVHFIILPRPSGHPGNG